MKPGPRPTPTALRKLAGNPGRRPLNAREAACESAAGMRMPRGLSAGARHYWQRNVPRLLAAGLLAAVDLPAAALMAEHYAMAREALRIIAAEGLQVRDETGLLRKHPLLQVVRDQSAAYRAYAAEFGMTPSSRSRISVPEPVEEDPFEEFMAEREGRA